MKPNQAFLDEAIAIGNRLCHDAIEFQGRVNWSCRRVLYPNDRGAVDQLPRLMNLNPTLYSGTAGVSLFLARLSHFTNDPLHREVSKGAMEHAIHHAFFINDTPLGKVGSNYRFGFYLGTLGIAWAALEVGKTLDDSALVVDAQRLVTALGKTQHLPSEFDLMNGKAGGIMALLSMSNEIAGAQELAVNLGKQLIREAVKSPDGHGVSWGTRQEQGARNLSGLSHGTSGVALALADLWQATGDLEFKEHLELALAYDDAAFQPQDNNWANYQGNPNTEGTYPVARAWCHGAPGIGISRAYLHQKMEDPRVHDDLDVAIRTTKDALADSLQEPGSDFMLCHGVGGLIEALQVQLDASGQDGMRTARSALRIGIDQHGNQQRNKFGDAVQWPTPTTNGEYPPLVTGIAGVGHLMLRAFCPEVPPILIPAQRWSRKGAS